MNEASALDVCAVRAIETADASRTLWSDDDRAWASRAAAEVVGADATADAFVARRATLALERLAARHRGFVRGVRAFRWRSWIGRALVAAALVVGFFADQVGGSQRINILAPPVLVLLAWNVVVYAALAIGYVVRYGDDAPGALRAALARASGLARPRRGGATRDAVLAFADDWTRVAAPLYAVRAARLLHVAAACLALGVVAGLYVRGLALEYRASWQSTFLDASTVRTIVAFAYAPGTWLTGIAVPPVDAIAAIRAPGSENAATWVHLMAATVALVVVAPRLVLAALAGAIERHRATRFPLALDAPYFRRLLRGYRGGATRVRVVPYSYALSPAAIAGVEAVVARAFGGAASIAIASPLAYGDDAAIDPASLAGSTVIVVFAATATPEREVHGALLVSVARAAAQADGVIAIVDESGWSARFGDDEARLRARRDAWRAVADEAQVPIVFVDLSAPDFADAENALDAAMGKVAR